MAAAAATTTTEYGAKEVASHRESNDAWMVIHGQVYDVTNYIHDHPGGADILVETAGTDATEAFDNAGHSEDAFEIMASYRVGKLKGSHKKAAPKAVKVMPRSISSPPSKSSSTSISNVAGATTALTLGSLGVYYGLRLATQNKLITLPALNLQEWLRSSNVPKRQAGFGFLEGFLLASTLSGIAGSIAIKKLSQLLHISEGFVGYPPHMKLPKRVVLNPLNERGWLDPMAFHTLPLVTKELIAPNTYRFVFELPTPQTVLGLPIGQHVSIKADVEGQGVQRSYTPVSNNADKGVLELVIKCYPDGKLTGGYLEGLKVGDEVAFRGPKGAMRYQPNLCRKIGMIAGGTGITPMYQLIRAICEDERDTTEISLIYANRTEGDILLRNELEAFARRYPKNLKIWYMLDHPPKEGWNYGSGFVTKELMADKLPAPAGAESKVMLCGPPGMVNAAKRALVELGFEKPGAVPKMGDQIFCF